MSDSGIPGIGDRGLRPPSGVSSPGRGPKARGRQAPFSQPMRMTVYALGDREDSFERVDGPHVLLPEFSLRRLFPLRRHGSSRADKLMEGVRLYGTPDGVAAEVERARSAARHCTIAHGVITGVILVSTFLVLIGSALIASACLPPGCRRIPERPTARRRVR